VLRTFAFVAKKNALTGSAVAPAGAGAVADGVAEGGDGSSAAAGGGAPAFAPAAAARAKANATRRGGAGRDEGTTNRRYHAVAGRICSRPPCGYISRRGPGRWEGLMRHVSSWILGAALLAGVGGRAAADEPQCGRWVIEVTCHAEPSRVIVGDPFTATLTVRNAGDRDLVKVAIALKGELNSHGVGGAPATVTETVEKLAPGESKEIKSVFQCDVVGMTRVSGGARDADGFATSNAFCTVDVIGLPAIQSEMTDKDLAGKEKGIFPLGEEFLYVLDVQNDVGSTGTPELKIVLTLPAELQYVSSTADRGVTFKGEGQAAESTPFVLAPNQVLKVTFRVKVIGRPASNLVMTRASIQTTGGVEVAEETESTTLK